MTLSTALCTVGLGGISTRLAQVFCPRADSHTGPPSLSEYLDVFARREVHAYTVEVVAADSTEQHIEGGYWLVWILCKPFTATRRKAFATDVIEEGWWTVKIQWFEYMPKLGESPRHYKLKSGERLLAGNARVRIWQIRFENSGAGGQRESRSGVKVLGYETHKNIQTSLPFHTAGTTVQGPIPGGM